MSQHWVPMNETLFENRFFSDVIKLRWGHTGLELPLNPMTGVLIMEGHVKTQVHTGVTMEADVAVVLP